MSTKSPLKNKTVLVTRPSELSSSLLQHINEAGGVAQHYPVLLISEIEESKSLHIILNNLSTFNLAIFISPTSVQKTLNKIGPLPKHLVLAAIGSSTKTVLNNSGYQVQIVPDDFNTESLLQHPSFQEEKIAGESIVIFRGVGGRNLLGNTLIQRGAKVTYAEMYRRAKNHLDSLTVAELSRIDIITVTSNQSLQNLVDLTDGKSKAALTLLPIIVPGERAYQLAAHLGFKTIIQSSNATDKACMQALSNHFAV